MNTSTRCYAAPAAVTRKLTRLRGKFLMRIKISHVTIAKLDIEHGDVIVVRVPPTWTTVQQNRAAEAVRASIEKFGPTVRVLVGTNDIEFQVLKPPLDKIQ
jgi:hypothetical protein